MTNITIAEARKAHMTASDGIGVAAEAERAAGKGVLAYADMIRALVESGGQTLDAVVKGMAGVDDSFIPVTKPTDVATTLYISMWSDLPTWEDENGKTLAEADPDGVSPYTRYEGVPIKRRSERAAGTSVWLVLNRFYTKAPKIDGLPDNGAYLKSILLSAGVCRERALYEIDEELARRLKLKADGDKSKPEPDDDSEPDTSESDDRPVTVGTYLKAAFGPLNKAASIAAPASGDESDVQLARDLVDLLRQVQDRIAGV